MEDRETLMSEATSTSTEQASRSAAVVYGDVEIDLRRAIRRAFPWLRLVQALRLSFGLGKIALAVVGVILLQLIWSGLDAGFIEAGGAGLSAASRPDPPWEAASSWASPLDVRGAVGHLSEPVSVLITPLLRFVHAHPFGRRGMHAALGCLAAIAVWGLIGGAIARIALVQAGWGRGLGLKNALEYATGHARPLVATPLLPLAVLLLTAFLCAVFGLVFRLGRIGEFLGGLFLIVPIGFGLLMFVMAAGLAAGWPLMVASVAAEGEDELDALSRSFSYLNHRLGVYVFYLGFALLIGIPGFWLVGLIADGTILMTKWGLALSAPHGPLNALFSLGAGTETSWAWSLPGFWIGLVRLIPRAWAYSYFWSSISIIYLLIRKDVDGAEWSLLKPDAIASES
jgi:hypothetical protein